MCLCCALPLRDLESRRRRDSDGAAGGPSCGVALHRRSGGEDVWPPGPPRPGVRAGVMSL